MGVLAAIITSALFHCFVYSLMFLALRHAAPVPAEEDEYYDEAAAGSEASQHLVEICSVLGSDTSFVSTTTTTITNDHY